MNIIENYLKNNIENMELSIYEAFNKTSSIYLLFNKSVLLSGIFIEHCDDVNYISYIDSTGFGHKITNKFIIAVLKSLNGLIVCFSYPKQEILFPKSSQNTFKNILNSINLFNYWIKIFKEICEFKKKKSISQKNKHENDCFFMTWSNFNKSNSFPYKKIEEIKNFKDDPKGKLLKKFKKVEKNSISINDFFNSLLFRYDFTKGGLLFAKCYCNSVKYKKEIYKTVNILKLFSFLRSLNFSNQKIAEESTKQFIEKFSINLKFFKTNKSIIL